MIARGSCVPRSWGRVEWALAAARSPTRDRIGLESENSLFLVLRLGVRTNTIAGTTYSAERRVQCKKID